MSASTSSVSSDNVEIMSPQVCFDAMSRVEAKLSKGVEIIMEDEVLHQAVNAALVSFITFLDRCKDHSLSSPIKLSPNTLRILYQIYALMNEYFSDERADYFSELDKKIPLKVKNLLVETTRLLSTIQFQRAKFFPEPERMFLNHYFAQPIQYSSKDEIEALNAMIPLIYNVFQPIPDSKVFKTSEASLARSAATTITAIIISFLRSEQFVKKNEDPSGAHPLMYNSLILLYNGLQYFLPEQNNGQITTLTRKNKNDTLSIIAYALADIVSARILQKYRCGIIGELESAFPEDSLDPETTETILEYLGDAPPIHSFQLIDQSSTREVISFFHRKHHFITPPLTRELEINENDEKNKNLLISKVGMYLYNKTNLMIKLPLDPDKKMVVLDKDSIELLFLNELRMPYTVLALKKQKHEKIKRWGLPTETQLQRLTTGIEECQQLINANETNISKIKPILSKLANKLENMPPCSEENCAKFFPGLSDPSHIEKLKSLYGDYEVFALIDYYVSGMLNAINNILAVYNDVKENKQKITLDEKELDDIVDRVISSSICGNMEREIERMEQKKVVIKKDPKTTQKSETDIGKEKSKSGEPKKAAHPRCKSVFTFTLPPLRLDGHQRGPSADDILLYGSPRNSILLHSATLFCASPPISTISELPETEEVTIAVSDTATS